MGVGLRLDAGTNGANKPTIGHWRADANRAAFFKAPLALLATVAPDAHDDAHADDDDERATHRLQAALSRCAPLFAGDVFAGATDAADKYARASRALDVQSHPRIEAQLRAGPPAGPDRLQLGSERLDEGTLAAILCALAATPSVVRLSLWHSALSAEGWGLLARLLPATAVCALDVSGQSAAGVDKEQWRPDRAALVSSCAPALTLLSVRHCELSSVHGAAALGRAVATHAALLGLDLSGNPLGDDGVIALARALGAGRPLLEGLALTSVRAGDAAAAALAALLAPRRPATADELAAHAAAVAAGLAPPMQVEVAAADGAPAALATTGGGGGGGKNRTAPAAKPAAASTGTKAGAPAKAGAGAERRPILSAQLPPRVGASYDGPGLAWIVPADSLAEASAAAQRNEAGKFEYGERVALGTCSLRWLSLAHNHVTHAGKLALMDATHGNETCRTIELAANPCAHAVGASLAHADLLLLRAAWGGFLAREFGCAAHAPPALVTPAVANKGKTQPPRSAQPTSTPPPPPAGARGASTDASASASSSASASASGEPTAASSFSVALVSRLAEARAPAVRAGLHALSRAFPLQPPQATDAPPPAAEASDAPPPHMLALARGLDGWLSQLLGALPTALRADADALLRESAAGLDARGVAVGDAEATAAIGAALEGALAAELDALGASALGALAGAEPIGAAGAGVVAGATPQQRVIGAVTVMWQETAAAAAAAFPLPAPRATAPARSLGGGAANDGDSVESSSASGCGDGAEADSSAGDRRPLSRASVRSSGTARAEVLGAALQAKA